MLGLFDLAPVAVFGASLLGSVHCAGMCGPIVLASASGPRTIASYNIGRLATYATFGAIAGGMGDLFLSNPRLQWIGPVATTLMTGLLVAFAVQTWRGKSLYLPLPNLGLGKRFLKARGPSSWASFMAGVATGFLPCGWLHSFIVAAALTKNAFLGAGLMFSFWLGTLPVMAGGVSLLRRVFKANSRGAQKVAAVGFLVAALMVVGSKSIFLFSKTQSPQSSSAGPICHDSESSGTNQAKP